MRVLFLSAALVLGVSSAAHSQEYHFEWVPQSQGNFRNVPGLTLQNANKNEGCLSLSPYYENRTINVNGVIETLRIVRFIRYENGSTETAQVKCVFLAASENAQQDAVGYLSSIRVYGADPTVNNPPTPGDSNYNPILPRQTWYNKGCADLTNYCVKGYTYPLMSVVRLADNPSVPADSPNKNDCVNNYDGSKPVFTNCTGNSPVNMSPPGDAQMTECYTNPQSGACPPAYQEQVSVSRIADILDHRLEVVAETIQQGNDLTVSKLDDLHSTLDQIAIQQREQNNELQAINQSVADAADTVSSAVESASTAQVDAQASTRDEVMLQGQAVASAVEQQGQSIKQAVDANTVAVHAVQQAVNNIPVVGGGGDGPVVVDTSAVVQAVNSASSDASSEARATREQIVTAATAVNAQASVEGAATRESIQAGAADVASSVEGLKGALTQRSGTPPAPPLLPSFAPSGAEGDCSQSSLYTRKHCGDFTQVLDDAKAQLLDTEFMNMAQSLAPPAVYEGSSMFSLDLRGWGYGVYEIGLNEQAISLIRLVVMMGAGMAALRIVLAA